MPGVETQTLQREPCAVLVAEVDHFLVEESEGKAKYGTQLCDDGRDALV